MDLKRIAQEAGFVRQVGILQWSADLGDLQRFASAVRREALEEAAKVCEGRHMGDNNREDMEARRCAAAIRSLADKEG